MPSRIVSATARAASAPAEASEGRSAGDRAVGGGAGTVSVTCRGGSSGRQQRSGVAGPAGQLGPRSLTGRPPLRIQIGRCQTVMDE